MTTAMQAASSMKFEKVEDWYPGLARYEARVEHVFWPGMYVIEARPSSVYANKIAGYTLRWVPRGMSEAQGRQFGSVDLGSLYGKGERKLSEAKAAVRRDREQWGDN